MEKIFVTGATGFIGQRLLEYLKSKGKSEIKILSRHPHPVNETVVCDLQSEVIPDDALDGVTSVFHLAGFAHDLRYASKVENIYRTVNVEATLRLAELAVRAEVERFVFISSVKAGGSDEDDLDAQTEGVYGQTKRKAELIILEMGRQSNIHVSIVRPSLVYGPGVKGNLALMSTGIEQWWFPPIPETDNRRSLIHVDDLVEAMLFVALHERANGEIFIATDGLPHSSREIYAAICLAVGKKVPKWSVPKYMFNTLSLLSPRIRYKVDKLFGDEYYSSKKLMNLGFMAKRTLKDWNNCE